MPGDDKQYAIAIGYIQGTDSTYYCDNVFYYDDPHQMYNFWPAPSGRPSISTTRPTA